MVHLSLPKAHVEAPVQIIGIVLKGKGILHSNSQYGNYVESVLGTYFAL